MTILLTEELSTDTFSEFVNILADTKEQELNIVLSCRGGDPFAALSYAAMMRTLKSLGVTINVHAYGLIASSAVLLLASGSHRMMSKEAWVMVHETTEKIKGTTNHVVKEAEQMQRLEKQWSDLLAGMTKTSSQYWSSIHDETTYLNAEECLELGLIDAII